jgi:hypothetical protein
MLLLKELVRIDRHNSCQRFYKAVKMHWISVECRNTLASQNTELSETKAADNTFQRAWEMLGSQSHLTLVG